MKLGKFHFGYNATENKGRRQAPKSKVYAEGEVLTKTKRSKMQATAQDQMRNHSLVAWMVRKHLDYVSKFHVSFRTGNESLDKLVNRIFQWHGAPRNLDNMGRFGRDEMFRLYELEKVIAGDAALIKLDELKLQAIESDLITKGVKAPDNVNDSGLVLDAQGRVVSYSICERQPNGNKPKFDHLEPIDNVIFDGYWTRFSSQFRGVSPLSTAINTIQDIHEAFEYNQIKTKMHALFGIAITRDPANPDDVGYNSGAATITPWVAEAHDWVVGDYCSYATNTYYCGTAHSTTTSSVFADDVTAGYWSKDTDATATTLDPRSINMLDLNVGEDVKVIESNSPSQSFIEGSYMFIQLAMLALDIPVTAFDSRRSSFSARIADLNEYEVSSDSKRTKNRYVRKDYSDWVLAEIWNDTETPWPLKRIAEAANMSLRDVQDALEWVASGSPWLDKRRQIEGDKLGISIGLDNPIDAARRRGANVFDNIDKIAQVQEYATKKGVALVVASKSDQTTEDIVKAELENAKLEEENETVDTGE